MESTKIFSEVPNIQYQEQTPEILVEEFRKVITSRRSVRVFDATPIPEAVMTDCLELALLSPNSSNLQPWEFYWTHSPEKKAKLIECCLSQPAARTAAELIVCVARTGTWKQNSRLMIERFKAQGSEVPKPAYDYYRKLVPLVYGQGPLGAWGPVKKAVVILRGLFTPTPREPASGADMRVWATKTTALAAETLMLALRAHGFDSCALEGFDSVRVKKLLELPSDAYTVMVIAAGKRAPNGVYGPRIRFESSLFIKKI
ncbi:MAG: nitroreductase [Bdellovibrionales bacterium RIFOXYC1_FULL_54_43]|nr:MAG: nitroreductase [Bdellovibrionales bacterium RIFOXYC1_FULL_54_43]OFZ85518.1 MAG: nitroreductase [Bdellovibrionales bacterium RIFOXYD1_FULL_55_31]